MDSSIEGLIARLINEGKINGNKVAELVDSRYGIKAPQAYIDPVWNLGEACKVEVGPGLGFLELMALARIKHIYKGWGMMDMKIQTLDEAALLFPEKSEVLGQLEVFDLPYYVNGLSYRDFPAFLEDRDYRPANIYELLAFTVFYPHTQRKKRIHAYGSLILDEKAGTFTTPCLTDHNGLRTLLLFHGNISYLGSCISEKELYLIAKRYI
jgi:hypothetical protein